MLGWIALSQPALAQRIHVGASGTAQVTYTDNVDFAPGGQRQSDIVGAISGNVSISASTPRLTLSGAMSAVALVDSRGLQVSGNISPAGNFGATYNLIDAFAWVDVNANISQNYTSPFGPQPRDVVNATSNRYTSQAYSVSPYVRGKLPGDITYRVRDDNTFTTSASTGSSEAKPPSTYANTVSANFAGPPGKVGWIVDYSRGYYETINVDNSSSVVETVRGIVPVRIDPTLEVSGRVGYERDRFLGVRESGSIYGVGVHWTPTDRSSVEGFVERRFFGTGYSLALSHRLPRIALSANFTRDVSTYPQLALTIPAGANVASFINAAFTTRIPDPTERATAVQQFLARSGLPATLFTPVNFYATTFLLQTSENVSAAWLGLRNSVVLSVFRVKSSTFAGVDDALPTSIVPPNLQFTQNNTQTGVGLGYNYALGPYTNLSTAASFSRVRADTAAPDAPITRASNANLSIGVGHQVGAYTTASFGMGYSRYLPEGSSGPAGVSAFNVYAAITHVFR